MLFLVGNLVKVRIAIDDRAAIRPLPSVNSEMVKEVVPLGKYAAATIVVALEVTLRPPGALLNELNNCECL